MELDPSPASQSLRQGSSFTATEDVAFSIAANTTRARALGALLGQLENPEEAAKAAAISYLSSRASATTTNRFSDVLKWIYPDRRDLIDFERNRFNSLSALGKTSAWNGAIERSWSDAIFLDCSTTRSEVRFKVRDWTGVQWRPAPVPVDRTLEQELLVRDFPEKYGLNIPDFPLTISGFGTCHHLTMVRTSQGWLVGEDSYEESIVGLGGCSPDYLGTHRASGLITKSAAQQSLGFASPARLQNKLGRTFDWASAAKYGVANAHRRNMKYCDFWPNDGANFVSQCLAAGGYATEDAWAPYTHAWVDSMGLRNWLLASGKSVPSDEGAMGFGDIIHFDWHDDAQYDHVAIVTGLPGPLVSSHTTDHQNVPFRSIAPPSSTFLFTTTLVCY